jgi:hypothetical protein
MLLRHNAIYTLNMAHLNELSPGDDARIAGSTGAKEAADYIEGIFKMNIN